MLPESSSCDENCNIRNDNESSNNNEIETKREKSIAETLADEINELKSASKNKKHQTVLTVDVVSKFNYYLITVKRKEKI